MMTAASASTSRVHTIELASPPPNSPIAGKPRWPKIIAQPSKALRTIPARLIASTQPGPLERGDEIAHRLERRNGSIDHM